MNNKQITREELVKAQKNHKREAYVAEWILSWHDGDYRWISEHGTGLMSQEDNFVLSALLAMSED